MTHALVHLEDPGAANLVHPLVDALSPQRKVSFITSGYASYYLQNLGLRSYVIDKETDAATMIQQLKPNVLLCGTSGNPDSIALDLIEIAKGRGLPSVGFVDFSANADKRFAGKTESPLHYKPDHILVSDSVIKQKFLDLDCTPDEVTVIGHPALLRVTDSIANLRDIDRDELRQSIFGASATKPIVLVPAEPMKGTYGEDRYQVDSTYTFPTKGMKWRTEVALKAILDALKPYRNDVAVILRLHPKCDPDHFKAFVDQFDGMDHHANAIESAHASDLVIGQTSMILVESAAVGVPTVSVIARPSEIDWLPEIPELAIPKATTSEELSHILSGWANAHHPRNPSLNKSDLPKTGEIVWTKLEEISQTAPAPL